MFKFSQDNDIVHRPSADFVDVFNYENGTGNGPDKTCPVYDMMGSRESAWNQEVYEILVNEFKTESRWGNLSDMYVKNMFYDRLRRLREKWTKGQLREVADGEYETEEEWETRMAAMRLEQLKKARHNTRRRGVSVSCSTRSRH